MMWFILLAVLTILVLWMIYEDQDPLDKLPGPRKYPLVGNIFDVIRMSQKDLFNLPRSFAKIYGDRFMLKLMKRRTLHVHHPKDVEMVLSHSRNIKKSKPYSFLRPWLGTGLLLSTGSKWFGRRRVLTPTFHFNILKNFAMVIEEKSRNFITKVKQHDEMYLDVFPAISDLTLFTICETAMGTQLDHDKSTSTVEYKSAILDIGQLIINRLTRFWLHNDFIFNSLPIGKQFYKVVSKVQSFADDVILERKKKRETESELKVEEFETKKRLAMLDLLLEAEEKGQIDLEGIREEVNTFIFEGHDTTATALTFGLMLLADHGEVQERIFEECKQIFGDSDRVANMADLAGMKYLEAVIKETLRLYPSVPFIAREITEDFLMGDLPIRKGIEVAVHIYDLHRREDLYPEPEAFKPERFLNNEARHPYAFVPFSAGPRNCIGQRFAMQEMKCVLSEICRHFKLAPKQKGWRPTLVCDVVLRSYDKIYIKFTRR